MWRWRWRRAHATQLSWYPKLPSALSLRACPPFILSAPPVNTGGGAALLHLSELLPAFRATLTDEEERLGCDIVMKALRAPCRIIAENAGVEGEVGCA